MVIYYVKWISLKRLRLNPFHHYYWLVIIAITHMRIYLLSHYYPNLGPGIQSILMLDEFVNK